MWTARPGGRRPSWTTTARPQLALVRGEGAHVWDAEGNRYVDLVAGIAVNALGHAHPAVVEAVTEPDRHAGPHLEPLHQPPSRSSWPRRCSDVAGSPARRKVLFCNSGAEAVEAAFKLTRRTGRTKIVACDGRVPRPHDGRARRSPASRPSATPFEPLVPGVTHVPFGDVAALERRRRRATRRRCSSSRSSGEGGVVVPPRPATCGRPARSPRRPARCSSSTRCRPASGGSAPGSPSSRPASCRTSSRSRRASAAGCRSARASASARRASCSKPGQHGTTFGGNPVVLRGRPRGAAHDRRRRPAASTSRRWARRSPPASRRWATRWSPRCGGRACCSASACASRSSGGGRGGRAAGRLPGQQRAARHDPARPAAGARGEPTSSGFLAALPGRSSTPATQEA